MGVVINLMRLELVMVLLAAAGVVLHRRGVITGAGQDCLTDLMMDLVLPCNIFLSFLGEADWETLRASLLTIAVSVAVMVVTALLGRLLYGRKPEQMERVFRYGLVNSNALFIGMPVIQSLLGAGGVLQLSMYMIFVRMFCWSYGLSLYTGVKSDWKTSVKRLLRHPCMAAAVLGLAVMLSGLTLPGFLSQTLQYVSDCLMALSMLLIGVVLAETDLRQLFRGDVWAFCGVRLVGIPALVFAMCRLMQAPYLVTATCTLISGMPAASMTAVLAARYRCDAETGSLVVAVSTMLSTVSIPLWYLFLSGLF